MSALAYPPEKRFHRFVALDPGDFIHPQDRGQNYTIIEISMFAGRSEAAKRALIQELFLRIEAEAGIAPHSVEITITETPKVNWGIRGANAADLALGYKGERLIDRTASGSNSVGHECTAAHTGTLNYLH